MPEKRQGFAAPDDPILIQRAQEIPVDEITSPETQQLIEKMLTYGYGQQTDRQKPILVGLAAPQVMISKRVILIDVLAKGHGESGDLRVYINPEITWRSPETNEWYEACFSTDRVCGIVTRPTRIRVTAYNREGIKVEEEHEDYTARIFQHEIDHLDGNEFTTHITDDSKLHWVEDSEFPAYRNVAAWRTWPIKCSRAKWKKIKGIKSK